jgi:hypothetical protein
VAADFGRADSAPDAGDAAVALDAGDALVGTDARVDDAAPADAAPAADGGAADAAPTCAADAVERRPCGLNGRGEQRRLCAGAAWTAWSACDDADECADASLESLACGFNGAGTRERTCADGVWSPWSGCDDPDECANGEVERAVCGLNGHGARARDCVAGRWQAWSACVDPDECVEADGRESACGLNGDGVLRERCVGGRWTTDGECVDPDVCRDGERERDDVACGRNGNGRRERLCADGQWGDWVGCADPDECRDGEDETGPCGVDALGTWRRVCENGRWSEWGACDEPPRCPDVEDPRCGPPSPERCNGLDEDHDGTADEGLPPDPAPAAPIPEGPFVDAVTTAVDRGLAALRTMEAGTGSFGRLDWDRRYDGLAVLAFLEHRPAGGFGPLAGYRRLEAADREMLTRVVAATITRLPALQDPRQSRDIADLGASMVGLAAWIRGGGPDEVGAPVTVRAALRNGVAALVRVQSWIAPLNLGGFGRMGPWEEADREATYYAAWALAAAAELGEDTGGALERLRVYLDRAQDASGGFREYPESGDPDSESTAVALWLLRLTGATPEEPAIVRATTWLAERYEFGGDQAFLLFTHLALSVTVADDDARFTRWDPAEVGHPDATAGHDFDAAFTLLRWQAPDGRWGYDGRYGPIGISAETHVFSVLTLERVPGALGLRGEYAAPAECANGLDDDGDGAVDAADADCAFPCTPLERRVSACANERDDDTDGRIDMDDPGCGSPRDDDEASPACANGRDDDGDGRTDFPAEPGCASWRDDDERDPRQAPACADGADGDGDGLVDWGADPDCFAASAESEGDPALACPDGVEVEWVPVAVTRVRGALDGANVLRGSCGGVRSSERVYGILVDRPTRLRLSTIAPETTADTVVYVRTGCADAAPELGCADDATGDDRRTSLDLRLERPGVYYAVVDGKVGDGEFVLEIERAPLRAACADGFDDDGDGRADFPEDPGCADAGDFDEVDPPTPPACADGDDGDGDGYADFPEDPGCSGPGDPDERDPARPPRCADGEDEDADGATDWPADPGCRGRGADSELDLPAACGNDADDDGDGHVDFPFDVGCAAPADPDEQDPEARPACGNQRDDDRDGRLDFPSDPGCVSAADDDERDPPVPPACDDRRDGDGDGLADFPLDPGCAGRGDDDETDPRRAPPCADGFDQDGDGLADFPDDPGCRFAADAGEVDGALAFAPCRDGVDDDGDGLVDFEDPGCQHLWDDEADPAEAPVCANGADDDGDGLTDFPGDPGCRFAGDVTEGESCTAPLALYVVPPGGGRVELPAIAAPPFTEASCETSARGAEAVLVVTLEQPSSIAVRAVIGRDVRPIVVDVRRACDAPESEIACGLGNSYGPLRVEALPAGRYYVFVRRASRAPAEPMVVDVTIDPAVFACNDGIDDDEDGRVDLLDPGCVWWSDDDETDPAAPPACADAIDDDEDGAADFPADAACWSAGDIGEEVPTCADPLDEGQLWLVPPLGGEFVLDEYRGRDSQQRSHCTSRSQAAIFAIRLPTRADLTFSVPGFTGEVSVWARRACDRLSPELTCDDDGGRNDPARITLAAAEPGLYYLFAASGFSSRPAMTVRVDVRPVAGP